jgi:hypothetical protein
VGTGGLPSRELGRETGPHAAADRRCAAAAAGGRGGGACVARALHRDLHLWMQRYTVMLWSIRSSRRRPASCAGTGSRCVPFPANPGAPFTPAAAVARPPQFVGGHNPPPPPPRPHPHAHHYPSPTPPHRLTPQPMPPPRPLPHLDSTPAPDDSQHGHATAAALQLAMQFTSQQAPRPPLPPPLRARQSATGTHGWRTCWFGTPTWIWRTP